MAKISGVIFLIVGLIVFLVSKYAKMTFFVYVGLLFIAFGSAGLVIKYILKKDRKSDKLDRRLPENMNNFTGLSQQQQNKTQNNDMYGYIGYCPTCQTPMRKINNYCHRCGMKQ